MIKLMRVKGLILTTTLVFVLSSQPLVFPSLQEQAIRRVKSISGNPDSLSWLKSVQSQAVKYFRAFEVPEWKDWIKKLEGAGIELIGPQAALPDLFTLVELGYRIQNGKIQISQNLLEDTLKFSNKKLRLALLARVGVILQGGNLNQAREIEKQIVGKSIIEPNQSRLDDFIKLSRAITLRLEPSKDIRKIFAFHFLLASSNYITVKDYEAKFNKVFRLSRPPTLDILRHDLNELVDAFPELIQKISVGRESGYLIPGEQKISPILEDRLWVDFGQSDFLDVALIGGKFASLGEQQNIIKEAVTFLQKADLGIPPGGGLTRNAQRIFIKHNNFLPLLEGLKNLKDPSVLSQQEMEKEIGRIRDASNKIMEAFKKGEMPPELRKIIEDGYTKLQDEIVALEKQGIKGIWRTLAARSSVKIEDLPGAAFPGQFHTSTGILGIEDLIEEIKLNWASFFNFDAISYALSLGIEAQSLPEILEGGIVIMPMVSSERAGTGFGVDTSSGLRKMEGITNGIIALQTVWGQGEAQVSNLQPGTWQLVGITPQDEFLNLWQDKGDGGEMITLNPQGGTTHQPVPSTLDNRFVLSEKEAVEVAKLVYAVSLYFGIPMDVEFGITDGFHLWPLQARPETVYGRMQDDELDKLYMTVPDDVVARLEKEGIKPVARGIPAYASGGRGKVIKIDESQPDWEKKLDKVGFGDLLVTKLTRPVYTGAMTRTGALRNPKILERLLKDPNLATGGVLTKMKGMNTHAAIVAREKGIATLLGVDIDQLEEGKEYTIDGLRGVVWPGLLPLKLVKSPENTREYPITETTLGLIFNDPLTVRMFGPYALANKGNIKVGLAREEVPLQDIIEYHPLDLLAYDLIKGGKLKSSALPKEVREGIQEKIEGYKSAREFFVQTLRYHWRTMALNYGKVTARTNDLTPDKFTGKNSQRAALVQGLRDPMMDNRGLAMELDSRPDPITGLRLVDAFEMELESLILEWDRFRGIEIMFPVVRAPYELKEAILKIDGMIKKLLGPKRGLPNIDDFPTIVAMYETPIISFLPEEFFSIPVEVNGVKVNVPVDISIGQNDYYQFTFGLDRNSLRLPTNPFGINEMHPAMVRGMARGITTENRLGNKSGSCGNVASFVPEFAPLLVALGISSVSVTPDVFPQLDNNIAKAEAEIKAKGISPEIESYKRFVYPLRRDANPQVLNFSEISIDEITKYIGIHPKAILDPTTIEDRIARANLIIQMGKMKPEEYYENLLYKQIRNRIEKGGSGPFVFRTSGMTTAEYIKLLGGDKHEPIEQEENPKLGFLGLLRNLGISNNPEDQVFKDIFKVHLRAALKASRDTGKKIIIQFDGVRAHEDLDAAIAFLDSTAKEMRLSREKGDFDIGLVVSLPSNLSGMPELLKRNLALISLDMHRLLEIALPANLERVYVASDWQRKASEVFTLITKTYIEDAQRQGAKIRFGVPFSP